jgi:hypothetical protein
MALYEPKVKVNIDVFKKLDHLNHLMKLASKEPSYTIPKDVNQSYFNTIERRSRQTPGPQEDYNLDLNWLTQQSKLKSGQITAVNKKYDGRRTFLDDAIDLSKNHQTSPTRYNPTIYTKNSVITVIP